MPHNFLSGVNYNKTTTSSKKGASNMRMYAAAMIVSFGMAGAWAAGALAADAGDGKAVFEKSCAGCHGKDGKGNPAMAKALGEKGLDLTTKDAKGKSDE